MTESSQFLDKLRERKNASGLAQGSPEEIQVGWLAELESLFTRLAGWLSAATEEELLVVEKGNGPIEEELLGLYDAPNLSVKLPTGEEVRIYPAARIVIGFLGRVDIVRGSRRRTLLKKSDGWVVLWGRSPTDIETLTQDAFERVLQELLPELA